MKHVIPSEARNAHLPSHFMLSFRAEARNRDPPGRGLTPRSGRQRFLASARNDSRFDSPFSIPDMPLIGWDIGGVNTKVARVVDGTLVATHTHPFELQHDPQALAPLLASL